MRARTLNQIGLIWLAFGTVAGGLLVGLWFLQSERSRLLGADAALAASAMAFERAAGYGGVIHHFKNFVLRPADRSYRDLLLRDVERAAAALDRIERIAVETEGHTELKVVRSTLAAYRGKIETIDRMHAQGASAREVDAAVRISDADAVAELHIFDAALRARLDAALRKVGWLSNLAYAVGGLFLIASIGGTFWLLRVSQREIAKVLDQLRRQNGDLHRLTQIAAHDLRMPLRHVVGLAECVVEDLEAAGFDLPDGVREHIAKIVGRATRLEEMVHELLVLLRAGTGSDEPQAIDLGDCVREVASVMVPGGAELALEGTFPVVHLPPAELKTVLRNLIGNAVKHGPEHGLRIVVRSRRSDGGIALEVEDNGPGVPTHKTEEIFDMFRTLDAPDHEDRVSGVGLALVRRIVRSWGGDILVRAALPNGAIFDARIPQG